MPPSRTLSIRLDALVQDAVEPVVLIGPDGRIVQVNKAWEELTGRSLKEVVGLACRPVGSASVGDLEGLAASFCPPPEVLRGLAVGSEVSITGPGGERIRRRVEFWPFHDARGSLLGLLGLVRPAGTSPLSLDSDDHGLRNALAELRERLIESQGSDALIGRGPEHRRLLDQVATASTTAVPTLIIGEAGTGKRLTARTIHARSQRPRSSFLAYDVAALPPEVLDRQLFGPQWLPEPRPLRAPEGSTLLVGDALDLPRDIQARLAAGLDGRVRLIATTAGEPDAALKAERLRPDFYFAITTLVLRLRPLRERLDELPFLAQHLLERSNRKGGHRRDGFSRAALEALLAHDWPGNLHELARVVDEARGRGDDLMIQLDDIPAAIRGARGGAYLTPRSKEVPLPLKERLALIERSIIEKALAGSGDNKSRAAKLLGVNRPLLYRRIKELGIADGPGSPDDSTTEDAEETGPPEVL